MSSCDPIEYDYARALDKHQAWQLHPQCPAKEDGIQCALDEGHDGRCDFDPYGPQVEGDEG